MIAGPIMCCVLGDELRTRAAGGDATATAVLLSLAPEHIPIAVRRRLRDAEIRRLAAWLHGAGANLSARAVAMLLATAGDRLLRGRGLAAEGPFAAIGAEERSRLAAEIERLINWDRGSWPRLRQMIAIVKGDGVQPDPA